MSFINIFCFFYLLLSSIFLFACALFMANIIDYHDKQKKETNKKSTNKK